MQIQNNDHENSGTNCANCERYKKLGEVCVVEHGKTFLWEYCKDFEAEIKLPDYQELMKTVRQDLAAERKKLREKKQKEIAHRRKERERLRKEKLHLKKSRIAKKVWESRRRNKNKDAGTRRKKGADGQSGSNQAKIPKTASSAKATV